MSTTPGGTRTGGTDWTTMQRGLFDTDAPLALFDVPGTRASRKAAQQAQDAGNDLFSTPTESED